MQPRRLVVVSASLIGLTGLLGVTGCTSGSKPSPTPSPDASTLPGAASRLATALTAKNLTGVPLADGVSAASATAELASELGPLAHLTPAVSAGPSSASGASGSATLTWTWPFPGVQGRWTYAVTADFVHSGDQWEAAWRPSLVEPDLFPRQRLSMTRAQAQRGAVLDGSGHGIVVPRAVDRIGLDKADVPAAQQPAAAAGLARLVGVDAKTFVAEVKAAGPKQFVAAITYRRDAAGRPSDAAVHAIPGARIVPGTALLPPTRGFAGAILGTVGDATKEIVDASRGTIVAGDTVGLSGLQRRYDALLRGQAGVAVSIVDDAGSASPAPTSSGTPEPSASPSPGRVVYRSAAVAGQPLRLSLDTGLQQTAESILSSVKPASALVVLRPSTGAVLAAATGPAAAGEPIATTGQYAPGSTFKVATSLALLRAGLAPATEVTCPARVVVDGKPFRNYNDYPSSALGTIPLRTAVAQSCNTAMIGQRDKVSPAALRAAAASLGLGQDYDTGFPSYFGSVPADASATGHAAAMIGQGKVLASPLAMAAVAASVAKGSTVIPWLVAGHVARPSADPITATEAAQLRSLMRAVVTEGSGRVLQGVGSRPVGAKTGTAEYGDATPPRTHAWMIAYSGDLAVAVFVADGDSGSHTAGPLLKKFLQAAS